MENSDQPHRSGAGIYKSLRSALAAGLLALSCSLPPAYANSGQDRFDFYTNTSIREESPQTENNFIYSGGVFSAGLNNISREGSKPRTIFTASLKPLKGMEILAYGADNGAGSDGEIKVFQELPKKFLIDAGIGDEGVFHGGVMYNRLQGYGFSLNYLHNYLSGTENKSEVEGSAWKYFEKPGIFVGTRKSQGDLLSVVSLPSNSGFAARYLNITDFEEGYFRKDQVILGFDTRDGYYSLTKEDSWFLLHDGSVFSPAAVKIRDNPLRYIVPPVAWRIKGGGIQLDRTENGDVTSLDLQSVAYLNDYYWIGADLGDRSMEEDGIDVDRVSVDFGKTSDKVKFLVGLGYDFNDNGFDASLRMRMKF
ncbi:MAG: hypothetical protein HY367_04155 [Candidatus Aenigmarchaeota archaeon]|nr:hypothetical protein [Candidatus Aenigmarchaeota archaeon]